MRISLTLQNEGHGLHRRGCWVSLKFSSFVNVSVEPSKGVWEVFQIPFPLAQRRKIKERGEEGDWDVWGARCAAGNSLINFRNRFSRTASIHFTLSPTFLSLAHWNDCDRGFGCLFAIQVVAASHSPEAWVGSQRNPHHHHHHLKGPWHPESCIIIREVFLHGGASGLDVGLLAGWKEQSVKAWAQPDRLIHLSFSLLQLSLTPQSVACPTSLLLAFSLSFSFSSYAVVAP